MTSQPKHNQAQNPDHLDDMSPDAPPSAAEIEAAAQLAQALDALQSLHQSRTHLDRLPNTADDSDLPALASLGLLLQSVERAESGQSQTQASVWQRIEQRLTGRALPTPERPMTWWRWLWVAVPTFAALALVVALTATHTPPPTTSLPHGPPASASTASPHNAPHAVAALDRQQGRYAERMLATSPTKSPTTSPADTTLRDYRQARLSAWQTDLLWTRRSGATHRAEVKHP